jgi:hypothetical protein
MSGETEANESGLTVDTLRLLMEQRFDDFSKKLDERYANQTKAADERYATQTKALDAAFVAAEKAVQTALDSADKAVTKMEAAVEKRFESVNEFRAQQGDLIRSFALKGEVDVKMDSLEKRVDGVEKKADVSAGRSGGMSSLYGWVIGAVGLVLTVVVLANMIYGGK